ncbi:Beta-lactamase class C/penicillin binding protein [Gaiella occulta]|uniref:Beta-lactamase class C/penicillin binding protein n=1 Tax=Gaiella occulta TaxID=1002870 RepID=A0A7M2YW53_9ACTN|nr:serine hydrolase domain-containing protein [Gaiella occulta]RDI74372.1 Beta-lactamase class C/penicillin binding protein [Gaiella occulta]
MRGHREAATPIDGTVAAGFEPVRETFAANFAERGEVGAAFAAYVDGQKVVDLWGGDARPGAPWSENTLCLVWSTTKGATALAAQILAERGQLDVDAPVARYWPEFAVNGKESVTVRDVLTHAAGLPYWEGYRELVTLDSSEGWGRSEDIARALAAAAPVVEPGAVHGYHAVTYGWLLGELVRRITGASLGEFFRVEVAEPLGLSFWIGLPPEEHGRVADLLSAPPVDDPELAAMMEAAMGPDALTGRALLVGPGGGVDHAAETANAVEFRAAEVPAANGVTDARSLARMYAMLAMGGELDGVRIVSPQSIAAHTIERYRGDDVVLASEKRYALGYMRPYPPAEVFGPNDEAFGHPGMGGSLGFADPVARVGFGYVMNQMMPGIQVDPRARALADALYASLR